MPLPLPLPLLVFFGALLLCGCATRPPPASGAAVATCEPAALPAGGRDPRSARAIAEARRQHRDFGEQTIERDGGMFRAGGYEGSLALSQRIAGFWQSVGDGMPTTLVTSAGRVLRSQAVPSAAAQEPGHDARVETAVRESLLRAAIVDTPWSAVFISHLMKTAGFSAGEFVFSDRHADYVQAAYETSAAEREGRTAAFAWRACDVASTPPREGDLLCATRADTARIRRFDALREAMEARHKDEAFPMHCDLVVHADATSGALDVIGGNVLHSVTLARMGLDARGLLDAQYIGRGEPAGECESGDVSCRGHLSRRQWVVVLQFRR